MRRKLTIAIAGTAILVFAGIFAWPRISYHMLTGSFFPIHKVESLENPLAVKRWTTEGLILENGRTVQLPGLRSLPKESAALAEATKRGVEIRKDGRVFGLMRIHHWCGNDPVREHIARVDLADLMMFLNLGEATAPVPDPAFTTHEDADKFSEYGWHVGQFFQFQAWCKFKDADNS